MRPLPELAQRVAALPYDVVDRYEARQIGEKNPLSFLHVDRAEMDLEPGIDIYGERVYRKARENLRAMREKGILIQDKTENYYIYELSRQGKTQAGVVGCASVEEYLNGTIKKHELTTEEKEKDRIRHVDACDANTGPIYLAARYPGELKKLIGSYRESHAPVYDFLAEDGIGHRVWVVKEAEERKKIEDLFGQIPAFYIADGHHRAASAVKVALMRRKQALAWKGTEEFQFFLSVVFPFDELTILPYHRLIKDRNGLTVSELIDRLKEHFIVEPVSIACFPQKKHDFYMYTDGCWYRLRAMPELFDQKDIVSQLDVSILQESILEPVLGIEDERRDNRIRFVGGGHSLEEMAQIADQTQGLVFALYATAIDDLMQIADEGKLMPPKSTWFEPKLRSGLFIHPLS